MRKKLQFGDFVGFFGHSCFTR